ncbi:unnamed protein product [Gongylonema pulchrum]|uniref:Importin N-terminal domain-containing protein n=1 Tax=Gongylonema pulchrum TaxID=637853 RepID=A0A183ENR2_9BILA|nr:unnamed protein product [Gongylonema pulchrum]
MALVNGTSAEICFQLERLFLRLATIENDQKLEAFVRKYLLEIIECTSTGESAVRDKGVEMLTHLNRRIKSNLSVMLPLEDIVQLIVLTSRAWIAMAHINQEKWPSLESLKNPSLKPEILRFFSDVLFFSDTS